MTTQVAKAERPPLTLKQLICTDEIKNQIALALPSHMTADRMTRAALTAMLKTPKLALCDQTSFMLAMLQLSQWGLEPDGRRAHLIPFENRKSDPPRVECQVIVDYKGLVELASRSGLVSNIHADVVCEHDQFTYDMGEIKTHAIDFRQPRGEWYAVYALVRMRDGSSKAEVLTRDEVMAIRDRSSGWQAFKKGYSSSNPWKTDEREMAKKTAFRRLSKWLPLSPEILDAADSGEEQVIEPDAARLALTHADRLADHLESRRQVEPETAGEPPSNEQGGE